MRKHRILTLFPIHCTGAWVSHICLSLSEYMRESDVEVHLVVPSATARGQRTFVRQAIPRVCQPVAYRVDRWWPCVKRLTERRYAQDMEEGDIAYLWPGVSIDLYGRLKQRGHRLVMERINCHRATARRILEEAYARAGWRPSHGITDKAIALEREKLAMADWVYSPSPWVEKSLLEDGVPRAKILASSYGWDPARFAGSCRLLPPVEGVTVLFAGTVCVRKGVHLLLEAWARAGVKGRLVLIGQLTAEIREHCVDLLNRSDVCCLGHVEDAAAAYRSADIFAFPSLEEGSPLVVYEAMASGLPCLLSPMAAGAVAQDGATAMVCDPYDRDGWINGLQTLARDAAMRRQLGTAARVRVEGYTWERVGNLRREQLLDAARSFVPAGTGVPTP